MRMVGFFNPGVAVPLADKLKIIKSYKNGIQDNGKWEAADTTIFGERTRIQQNYGAIGGQGVERDWNVE